MTSPQDNESTVPNNRGCPYLGTYLDKTTRYGYPSENNYCHFTETIDRVNLYHQRSVCLTPAFEQCPVYLGKYKHKLPDELRGEDVDNPPVFRHWDRVALAIILIFVILIFINRDGFLRTFQPSGSSLSTSPGSTKNTEIVTDNPKAAGPTQVSSITAANLIEPLATSTLTQIVEKTPTHTATPTNTPIPSLTPGPILETPFGPDNMYLIYKVIAGESLPMLADRFETSIEVIRKVNRFNESQILIPNQVIVILPGVITQANAEPLLAVYLEVETIILKIATQFGVTEEEVREYNSLGTESALPEGRWLVLPLRKITATETSFPSPTINLERALTLPFGPEENYVIHQVRPGESMALLETLYLTSEAVIRQMNGLRYGLQVDQVLVIYLNKADPTGITPLSAYQVDEEISIEALAIELEVLLSELIYHNGLANGVILLPGQWIVYPSRTN